MLDKFINSTKFNKAISSLNKGDKIVYCDIDGTIYRDSLFLDLMEELIKDGYVSTNKIRNYKKLKKMWKQRSIDYEEFLMYAVIEIFEKILHKIPFNYIKSISGKIITAKGKNIFVYTFSKLKELQNQGYKIIFISGSPIEIVQEFAKRFGFDVGLGTYLSKGKDGNLQREYVLASSENKLSVINYINELVRPQHIISFGDTTGDLGMLESSNLGYAINPTKGLYEKIIHNNNIIVIVERKDLLLELNSISRKNIISL